jgi:hypothetical protein
LKSSNRGGGKMLSQTCYLVRESRPDSFGALREISRNAVSPALQSTVLFTF